MPTYTYFFLLRKLSIVKSLSPVTLCDLMDCSLPGSPVYGTFQARVLEWVAISSPGDEKIRMRRSGTIRGSVPDPRIEPGSPVL